MRIIRDYTYVTEADRGASVAIGNFDGVHIGHLSVIDQARAAGARSGAPLGILTFEPHPREFFRHDDVPFCLADRIEKDRLLAAAGVDRVIHVTFDDNLRCTDAAAFVTNILPAIGVTGLFAGSDFAFGRSRGGDIDTINAMGADIGITAAAVPLLSDENSAVISSSRIRAALQAGEVGQAGTMLGHDWAVTGIVKLGDQRGRTIGFPTLNLHLGSTVRPALGVYAVRVGILEGGETVWHDGVANIGKRPTFGGEDVILEAHLMDFSGDLYGKLIAVTLIDFIRAEKKFDGLEALRAQIAADTRIAQNILVDAPA